MAFRVSNMQDGKKLPALLLIFLMISSVLMVNGDQEIELQEVISTDIYSSSGNNTTNGSNNTVNSTITITSPQNYSDVHGSFGVIIYYSVQNYTGTLYWNSSTVTVNGSILTNSGTSIAYSNTSNAGQNQGNFLYFYFSDFGNNTVCIEIPFGEHDCVSFNNYYVPTSMEILSPINNQIIYSIYGKYSGSINISLANYSSGPININLTNHDNNYSNSWNGYKFTRFGNFTGTLTPIYDGMTNGNYTLCVTLSTGHSDCVNYTRINFEPSISINSLQNGDTLNVNSNSNISVDYTLSNYSGSVVWQLISSTTNSSAISWYDSAYLQTSSSSQRNLTTNIPGYSISFSDNYQLCASLNYVNYTSCVNITILLPPSKVRITSLTNNSVITMPYYQNNYVDFLELTAIVENYTYNYVYWNISSSNLNNSFQSWSDYVYSSNNSNLYSSQYRRVGFGNVTVCASIVSYSNNSINPNNVFSDCKNINVIPRQVEASIISYQNLSNSSNFNSINLEYFANNYSNGEITVNGNRVTYLSKKFDNNLSNNTDYTISYYHFNYGNNVICLELYSEDNSLTTECVNYIIPYPVVRLNVISPVSQTTILGNEIQILYSTENYSGYISWTIDGNQVGNSYSSNSVSSITLNSNSFGSINICGSINLSVQNNSSQNSIDSCFNVNLIPKTLEGYLISPNSTYTNSNSLNIDYWASNYTYGEITVNGNNYYNLINSSSWWNNNNSAASNNSVSIYLSYGNSLVCLELYGQNNSYLVDCVNLFRNIPNHVAQIDSPLNNSSFVGNIISVSYTLQNSSNHYFTVNGNTMNYSTTNVSNLQFNLPFGNNYFCLVSFDYANQQYSDCISVENIDPNLDSDGDGISDLSDNCPNTPISDTADSTGCGQSQIDSDGDGVMNSMDNCPNTMPQQSVNAQGCSASQRDSDGDGINDSTDLCPNTLPNAIIDSNGCSTSQIDSDNDGVNDNVDICPNTFVGSQVDSNGCAPSQKDSDSDGIADSFDQCPNTPFNTVVDSTGCDISSSGSSNGTTDDSDSDGLPGFQVSLLIVSMIFAAIIISKRD